MGRATRDNCTVENGGTSTVIDNNAAQLSNQQHQSERGEEVQQQSLRRCNETRENSRVTDNRNNMSDRSATYRPAAIPHIVQMQVRDTMNASDVRRTSLLDSGVLLESAINYGSNETNDSRPFLLQFLLLSSGFGLPLLLFLMSLGQYLGSGFLDLWFISPAFKGIGAAFLFTYIVIAIYESVPIAWLFIYFRDSFLSARDTPFKWAFCSLKYNTENCIKAVNLSRYEYVGWSVSAYFHTQALKQSTNNNSTLNTLSSQVDNSNKINIAFNLALIWSIIFIVLSRGLNNAGKIFITITVIAVVFFSMVSFRFIEQFGKGIEILFTSNEKPFLTDSMSWLLAAREAFLIWTAFGSVVLNVCSHNKSGHNLIRQLIILFALVIAVLFIAACFFASTMEVIKRKQLNFIFSSYEEESLSTFVRNAKVMPNGSLTLVTSRLISGSNSFLGEHLFSTVNAASRASHYAILRFATEVFPAVLALEGSLSISSFWAMAFYLSAILFNLGSLLVLWGSVIDAIVSICPSFLRMWKSLVAFVSCLLAFLLTLPFTSGNGLFVLYYVDFAFGSLWWLSLLYLLQIIAVLIIRGRPCGAENLVAMLTRSESTRNWLLPLLTFHWNLIIPVIIMVLSIAFTRSYSTTGITWTQLVSIYPYWVTWAQYFSIFLQILPLLIVLIYGIIQSYIYLCPSSQSGATHERLQALFCPIITTSEVQTTNISTISTGGIINDCFVDEPPPKYTPPPSYSTATARTVLREFRNRIASSITIDLHFLGSQSGADTELTSPATATTTFDESKSDNKESNFCNSRNITRRKSSLDLNRFK
ncbi:sodium-dependent proline transporter-like protein [Dinothrombium tinctorium]|uniref:Sodium-dependent proline transporter-like protein n=1 Tax=Dinothrombium tinctorium TaxID=1965070 RepID=A0A3S3S885_9ACAR|nr:sodium-dependent proline transporter-like protein [Dinothrombium tinctorium]